MNDYPPAFRRADIFVLTFLVLAALGCWYHFTLNESKAQIVTIKASKGEPIRLSLPDNESKKKVNVKGPLGTTLIELSQEGVRFVTSPCPHGVCVNLGLLTKSGHSGACVPNGIIVHLEGQSQLDALTQ